MRILGIVLFLLASLLHAELFLLDDKEEIDAFSIEYFYDKNASFKLSSVQNELFELRSNTLALPVNSGNMWFRFQVQNSTDHKLERVISTPLNLAEFCIFYVLNQRGELLHEVPCHSSMGLEEREIPFILHASPFTLEPNEIKTIYLQLRSELAIIGKFQIHSIKSLSKTEQTEWNFFYFYFGVIIAMIIYNGFISLYYQERVYVYYTLYLLVFNSWIFLQSGLMGVYFPQEYHNLPYYVIPTAFMFFILFTKALLQQQIKTKLFHNWSYGYIILFAFLPLLSLWSLPIMLNTTMVVVMTFYFYAVYILVKGNKKTLPYTIALGIYLVSMSNIPLLVAGIVPFSRIVINANVLGALIETLMLSIILANRLSELKQEKIALQDEMILIQADQNRLLKEKVEEQTKNLKILFQELHHRVKNNLQFIQASLWLKKKRLHHVEGIQALESTERRIQTIATMHELLYAKQETQIDLKHYIQKVIQKYSEEYPWVRIDLEVVSFHTTMHTAVTLGLILNELITNSLKHAFTDVNEPRITIEFIFNQEMILFSYKDNGSGFDENKQNNSGLGNILVKELVRQLAGGTCECSSDKSVSYLIRFNSKEEID